MFVHTGWVRCVLTSAERKATAHCDEDQRADGANGEHDLQLDRPAYAHTVSHRQQHCAHIYKMVDVFLICQENEPLKF